jgi:hypothetical protein
VFGRLVARGHRVTLLCSGWKGAEAALDLDGMRVVRAGGRYTFTIAAPLCYAARLAGEHFDVVVEDLNKVPMLAPRWAEARARLLLVHHLFGPTAFQEANPALASATWLFERIIPSVYRGLDCVAVSESTRDDLVRRGLDPDRIEVIRNGVDLEGLGPARERSQEPTVVFLGRVKRYKRVDLVLQAVAREHGREARPRLFRTEGGQITHLGLPENQRASVREAIRVSGKRETRTRDVGVGDMTVERHSGGEQFESQQHFPRREEIADADRRRHRARTTGVSSTGSRPVRGAAGLTMRFQPCTPEGVWRKSLRLERSRLRILFTCLSN